MRQKAVWFPAVAPKHLESQRDHIRLHLGSDSDLEGFLSQGNEALNFYWAIRAINRKSRRPKQHNEQLSKVARHANALAKALESLDSDPWHLLDQRRTRLARDWSLPDGAQLREIAADAKSCRMPIRRGAPINGALILLTRDIASAYEAATGRRATWYANGPFHQILLTVFDVAGIKSHHLSPIYRRALRSR